MYQTIQRNNGYIIHFKCHIIYLVGPQQQGLTYIHECLSITESLTDRVTKLHHSLAEVSQRLPKLGTAKYHRMHFTLTSSSDRDLVEPKAAVIFTVGLLICQFIKF